MLHVEQCVLRSRSEMTGAAGAAPLARAADGAAGAGVPGSDFAFSVMAWVGVLETCR